MTAWVPPKCEVGPCGRDVGKHMGFCDRCYDAMNDDERWVYRMAFDAPMWPGPGECVVHNGRPINEGWLLGAMEFESAVRAVAKHIGGRMGKIWRREAMARARRLKRL